MAPRRTRNSSRAVPAVNNPVNPNNSSRCIQTSIRAGFNSVRRNRVKYRTRPVTNLVRMMARDAIVPGTSVVNGPITTVETGPANLGSVKFTKLPEAPKFKGRGLYAPIQFITAYENHARKAKWDDATKLQMLSDSLTGVAENWAALRQDSWESYADFRRDFVATYWSVDLQRKVKARIATAKWNKGESMLDHFTFYARIARELTNKFGEEELVGLIMDHFPFDTRCHWMNQPNKSVDNALKFLQTQDLLLESWKQMEKNPKAVHVASISAEDDNKRPNGDDNAKKIQKNFKDSDSRPWNRSYQNRKKQNYNNHNQPNRQRPENQNNRSNTISENTNKANQSQMQQQP